MDIYDVMIIFLLCFSFFWLLFPVFYFVFNGNEQKEEPQQEKHICQETTLPNEEIYIEINGQKYELRPID